MTNPPTIDKSSRALLLIAVVFVAAAFGLWGAQRGWAALIGASLSVVNWLTLRWLTGRIVDASSGANKTSVSLLLVAKMGLLIGLVYILIARLRVDPIGLAFGLGVLFIGPVVTSLVSLGRPQNLSSPSTHPSAAGSAREER